MEQPRQGRLTADEFMAWAAEQATGRFELADGVAVGMAPERVGHSLVDTDKRIVIHHRRDEEGAISVRILHGGPLALDPPGLEVETGDIFASL